MPSDAETRVIDAVRRVDSGTRWLVRRELQKLPAILESGEEIAQMAQARLEDATGLVVATDRRLLFLEASPASSQLEEFPYYSLASIEPEVSLIKSQIEISCGGEEAKLHGIYPKDQTIAIADYVRGRLTGPS